MDGFCFGHILRFIPIKEVILSRLVCKKWNQIIRPLVRRERKYAVFKECANAGLTLEEYACAKRYNHYSVINRPDIGCVKYRKVGKTLLKICLGEGRPEKTLVVSLVAYHSSSERVIGVCKLWTC
jgi:hypothetical protein